MKRTSRITKALLGGGLVFLLVFTLISSQAFAQGTWETKTPMFTARNSPHVAAIGGLLYVAGGQGAAGVVTGALEVYNPATDTWIAKTSMPWPVNAGSAGVIDGKLYVVGGWNPPITNLPTRKLQIYDPATNQWSLGPDFPTWYGSGCSAAGVIDRKLYVLTPCLGYGGYYKDFVVFDPDTNSWSSLPQPPNTHIGPAAGVIDGMFYLAGGANGTWATLDVYDPVANTWTTKAPMPTARHVPFGGVLDGKLYVAGGWDGNTSLDTLEVYDPATDTWTTMPPMPTARHGAHIGISSPAIDGKLYIVGGFDGTNNLTTLEVFSPIVPPEQATHNLIDDVQSLVDTGTLTADQGDGATAKLEAAIASLYKGNTNATCGQLRALINQINAFINDGTLTSTEGQDLIDAADNIRNELGCR